MKKFLLGLITGIVTGVGVSYLYHKKNQNHDIVDDLLDEAHKLVSKGKRKYRDVVDKAKNQAEYYKERAEYRMNKKGDVDVDVDVE